MNPYTGEIKRMADLKGIEKELFSPITNKKANKEAEILLKGKHSIIPNFEEYKNLSKEQKALLKKKIMEIAIMEAEKKYRQAQAKIQQLREANYGTHAIYEKLVKEGFIDKSIKGRGENDEL